VKSLLLFIPLLAVGCGASNFSTYIVSPSGDGLIDMHCDGHSQSSCNEEARRQCQAGYDVQVSEGQFTEYHLASAYVDAALAEQYKHDRSNIIIRCRTWHHEYINNLGVK
jgi:hypothetical protein